jgi:prefoldin subunit 5
MAKKPSKTPDRTLEELLRVSKELRDRSAKMQAESVELSKRCEEIAEQVKRLSQKRYRE